MAEELSKEGGRFRGDNMIKGKIIQDNLNGRFVIYDSSNREIMWIGNCGNDSSGNPLYGIMVFGTNSIPQGFFGFQQGGF